MLVRREFKLIGGRLDYQYVSSVNGNGEPTGYDKDIKYALNLSEWQLKRVVSVFKGVGAKWSESLS